MLLNQRTTSGAISPEERVRQVAWALGVVQSETSQIEMDAIASTRARELVESYERLQQYVGGSRFAATPYRPDILGVYVFVPGGEAQ